MKFKAYVESMVPRYYRAEVEVDAIDKKQARNEIQRLYDLDEIYFDGGENNYDGAEIVDVTFSDEVG